MAHRSRHEFGSLPHGRGSVLGRANSATADKLRPRLFSFGGPSHSSCTFSALKARLAVWEPQLPSWHVPRRWHWRNKFKM